MVEGVVAIPFFLLIFSCLLYIGHLYSAKMKMMRLAKESAWDYAMCNCGESGDKISSKCNTPEGAAAGSGGAESGKPDGYDPADVAKGGSGPGSDLASRKFGSSLASMEGSITADKLLGGFTQRISTRTKVMCNEAPHNGDLKGWGSAAFDAFKKW